MVRTAYYISSIDKAVDFNTCKKNSSTFKK